MPSNVAKHPDLPVIIRELGPEHRTSEHGQQVVDEDLALMDAQTDKFYYIIDASQVKVDVVDLVQNIATINKQVAVFKHPKIIESLVITQNITAEFALRSFARPIFGGVSIKVHKTLEDALKYIRQKLGQ
jgi:hypothetical protein